MRPISCGLAPIIKRSAWQRIIPRSFDDPDQLFACVLRSARLPFVSEKPSRVDCAPLDGTTVSVEGNGME